MAYLHTAGRRAPHMDAIEQPTNADRERAAELAEEAASAVPALEVPWARLRDVARELAALAERFA